MLPGLKNYLFINSKNKPPAQAAGTNHSPCNSTKKTKSDKSAKSL